MEYAELFEKALRGRSVNQASKDWDMPQGTLAKYANGKRVPDYQTALILALEAKVDAGEVLEILAKQEGQKKPRSVLANMGFALGALLLGVNLFLTPSPAKAQPIRISLGQSLCYVKLDMHILDIQAR